MLQAPKADALPDCATPRRPFALGEAIDFSKPALQPSGQGEAAIPPFLTKSPGIVPEYVPPLFTSIAMPASCSKVGINGSHLAGAALSAL